MNAKPMLQRWRALADVLALTTLLLIPMAGSGAVYPTGSMSVARRNHTASLLPDGRVLVAGGFDNKNEPSVTFSAEIYDPARGTWLPASPMSTPRAGHTASVLASGRVLVAAGWGGSSNLDSAEVYDPLRDTWTRTPSIPNANHNNHTATVLADGRVLLAGGHIFPQAFSSVDIYDPVMNAWSSAAPVATRRTGHDATLLHDGRVLIVGGVNDMQNGIASVEAYHPVSGTWTSLNSMAAHRMYLVCTRLADGRVLVTGGYQNQHGTRNTAAAEVFNPVTGRWETLPSMSEARYNHASVLLPSGEVLVAGGQADTSVRSSTELFNPSSGAWRMSSSLLVARAEHTATLLLDGRALIVGGMADSGGTLTPTTEIYGPALPRYSIGLMASPATGGTVHGAGTYDGGQILTISAVPAAGYVFSHWSENGALVSGAASYTFAVSAHRVLVAQFNPAVQPLVVSAGALAQGTVGTPYSSQALTATGGVRPYSWVVAAGSLPAGLSLSQDGILQGTPLAAGTSVFTVLVRDQQNTTATREFQLVVNPATLIVTASLSSATAGTAYTQALTAAGATRYYQGQRPMRGVGLTLVGGSTLDTLSAADGTYRFLVEAGRDYTITPVDAADTSASWGVTTADLALIRRHALDGTSLTSPFQLLAADANGSRSVTTGDILVLRRVALGFPNPIPGGLWRFVRSDVVFPNARAPWDAEASRSYTALAADHANQDFVAIKLGDVNGSWTQPSGALAEAAVGRPPRALHGTAGHPEVTISIGDSHVDVGGTVTVPVRISGFAGVTTFQFTVGWDPAVLQWLEAKDYGIASLAEANFNLASTAQGWLAVSWDDPNLIGATLPDGSTLFSLAFRAVGPDDANTKVALRDDPVVREVTVDLLPFPLAVRDGLVQVGRATTAPPPGLALRLVEGRAELTLSDQTGISLDVLSAPTPDGPWNRVATVVLSEPSQTWIDPRETGDLERYYRLRRP